MEGSRSEGKAHCAHESEPRQEERSAHRIWKKVVDHNCLPLVILLAGWLVIRSGTSFAVSALTVKVVNFLQDLNLYRQYGGQRSAGLIFTVNIAYVAVTMPGSDIARSLIESAVSQLNIRAAASADMVKPDLN